MKGKLLRLLLLTLVLSVFLFGCGSDGSDGADGRDGEDGSALPKHVILFIGDGMHEEHEAAASRYSYGEEESLIWHDSSVFSYRNYASTWDVSAYNTLANETGKDSYDASSFDAETGYDVKRKGLSSLKKDSYFIDAAASATRATDSASAGTAIATGVKTDDGNLAWESGDPVNGEIETIAEYYKTKTTPGKIGVVTTVPFSHATPAAFVSHNVYRNNYVEIIEEIITDTRPDVVIGTGQYMTSVQHTAISTDTEYEFVERTTGVDGTTSLLAAASDAVTNNTKLFATVGSSDTGQVPTPLVSHVPGTPTFTKAEIESPLLKDSTEAALEVLSTATGSGGFFVMIEQGDIDWSNHSNNFRGMVGGVLDLHEAVAKAEEMVEGGVNGMDWTNTTIIVTSDHGNNYMRFNRTLKLGQGELPAQITTTDCPSSGYTSCQGYPDGEVFFGSNNHTNELVSVYAKGANVAALQSLRGNINKDTDLLDNTDLYRAMKIIADNGNNVILFIGDGMQKAHEIAGSRYMFGTDEALSFNAFPFFANATTWDVTAYNTYARLYGKDSYAVAKLNNAVDPLVGYNWKVAGTVPYPLAEEEYVYRYDAAEREYTYRYAATDSASSGTAFATGVKTVDGNIAWLPGDAAGGEIRSIVEKVQEQRRGAVGVVTTVPFSHATPAAFVSHNINRNNYVEIIQEIIDITKPDVVLGTAQHMTATQRTAVMNDSSYVFVERTSGVDGSVSVLAAADSAAAGSKKLFATVGSSTTGQVPTPLVTHSPNAPTFTKAETESPLLADSTEAALKVLAQNRNGFFLMVEQGDIDWANHSNDYRGMVGGVLDLEEAVKKAIEYVDLPGDNIDWSNTLLIVTSDHGNSMLRTNSRLAPGLGELPEQVETTTDCPTPTYTSCYTYPDGTVFYGTNEHTNELVSVYAKGDFANETLGRYNGSMYESGLTEIIDNTLVFKAMANFLGVSVSR